MRYERPLFIQYIIIIIVIVIIVIVIIVIVIIVIVITLVRPNRYVPAVVMLKSSPRKQSSACLFAEGDFNKASGGIVNPDSV